MDGFLGLDVHDAALGILGYGRIGQALARRAHAFGMSVRHHGGRTRDDGVSRPTRSSPYRTWSCYHTSGQPPRRPGPSWSTWPKPTSKPYWPVNRH